jgi:hypothetical protein
VASFLSFFRFDFGFSDVIPPRHGQRLCSYSYVQYKRLGIPQVLVNSHGIPRNIPADVVCERWERDRFLPISGPKDCHFVVFCQNDLSRPAIDSFFKEFSHIYQLRGFGRLSPMPRGESVVYETKEGLTNDINKFFQLQPLSEFQTYPIVSFIVAPPIYDRSFEPHSIITYVQPWSVTSGSEDEIRTLALVVYSRIRIFTPSPFGMIDIARFETSMLFFGFRYQPPYILPRSSQTMIMHIAWDQETRLTAWMDDIGSVLHVVSKSTLEELSRFVADLVNFLRGTDLRLTLTVLGEGINDDLFHAIEKQFGRHFRRTVLFALAPAPAVQVALP